MAIEIPSLSEMFNTVYSWQQGKWPVEKGDEIKANLFEDCRKWVWLLTTGNRAGNIDLAAVYGISYWDANGYVTSYPYTRSNWPGQMNFSGTYRAGLLWVYFKDDHGVSDLYVNKLPLNYEQFVNNPPITGAGNLSNAWSLAPDPNKYYHYSLNAGRPTIGATSRRIIVDHPQSSTNCGQLPGYTSDEPAYKYLPQQLDWLHQKPPVKIGGTIRNKIEKVELTVDAITKWPVTHHSRSIDTVSYEPCNKGRKLNEFVMEGGEPWRVNHPDHDPNYVDPLMNYALQDQIVRACEIGTKYGWPVTEEWQKNYVHYNAQEWDDDKGWSLGNIAYISEYNPDGTYPDGCFYMCKKPYIATPGDPRKPGTASGEAHWHTPAYDQRYTPYNISFAYMQDVVGDIIISNFYYGGLSSAEYWDCNGSVFELCLKNLGEYDWYFDTGHPYMPWWMYKWRKEYPSIAYEMPPPRGTWRMFWKHTMGRPGPRSGDNVVGEYLIWPGELGFPPGYWTGRNQIYKRLKNRFIVSQPTYDRITMYTDEYRVVDVEGLYKQARIDYGEEAFDRLLERHDSTTVIDSEERFEVHHDLLNHCRCVLCQLRYYYTNCPASLIQWENCVQLRDAGSPPDDSWEDTSYQAIETGKRIVDSNRNLMQTDNAYQNWYTAEVSVRGEVNYTGAPTNKWTSGLVFFDTAKFYGKVAIKLYEGTYRALPSFPTRDNLMFHLKFQSIECASGPPPAEYGKRIFEPVEVGVAGKSIKPSCADEEDGLWLYDFVAGAPSWEGWYTPDNGTTWQYWVYFWIVPNEDWMPSSYFANAVAYEHCEWWKVTTCQLVETGYVDMLMEINFDNYDVDVFRKDPNNYEVV